MRVVCLQQSGLEDSFCSPLLHGAGFTLTWSLALPLPLSLSSKSRVAATRLSCRAAFVKPSVLSSTSTLHLAARWVLIEEMA